MTSPVKAAPVARNDLHRPDDTSETKTGVIYSAYKWYRAMCQLSDAVHEMMVESVKKSFDNFSKGKDNEKP